MDAKDIVKVNIDIDDQVVSQEGFGIPLILGANKVFNERYRLYNSTDEMLSDGFTNTDPEYLAATAVFEQNITVDYILVGRRTVDEVTITITTATNSTQYKTTINGTDVPFTSDSSATPAEIAAGLVLAINTAALGVTATDETNGVYSVIAGTLGTPYTIKTDALQTITKPFVATDPVADDLTAVLESTDDWYGLVLTSRTDADVKGAAAWIQTNNKIFFTPSNNVNILDTDSTTDIAYFLKSMLYDRTAVIYHPDNALYPDAAAFGARLPFSPGDKIFTFAQLVGIPGYKLTSSQSAAALAKNCNIVQNIAGIENLLYNGRMSSGRFIDIRRDVDWLISIIITAVLQRLLDQVLPKVPFTDPGIAIIENIVRGQLNDAVAAGVLSANPRPDVIVPKVKNISPIDKTNRKLTGITITAELAGAIIEVDISGIVLP